jgi:hypothetical protein
MTRRPPPLTLGLLLTLDDDEAARRALLEALDRRDDVTRGEPDGARLPLALETAVSRDREALAELGALPGVVFCDVVYAHFEDSPTLEDEP